ncbi:MAG: GDP-mannose 4,6-dehydratase [Actinomycetota bacterium]|jgi:GDPmannose 4,6-dehydratase
MSKVALITGITGQDGSYLAELLLDKGYTVHGLVRRSSSINTDRIDHLHDNQDLLNKRFFLHFSDLSDSASLTNIVEHSQPDEIYNLAAQSHVRVSFDMPYYTGEITGLGATRILEVIRAITPDTKFYQASSSEMYGQAPSPQNEETPFVPRSPYGAAKLYAHSMTRNYREAYGLFAVNGILFNHESPRRGETFVTKKIARGLARISKGIDTTIKLGNLDAKRDWGYAPEYVEGMWRMMQHSEPLDFVLATNTSYSVRDFLDLCGKKLNLDWQRYVEIDERYFRPSEIDVLVGDYSKAEKFLGWKPQVLTPQLAAIMVEAELNAIS